MQRAKSRKLFNKTKKMIPGGVNSLFDHSQLSLEHHLL